MLLYISTILDKMLSFLSSVLDNMHVSLSVVLFNYDYQSMESAARPHRKDERSEERECAVVSGVVLSVHPVLMRERMRIAVDRMMSLLKCMVFLMW